MEFKQSRTLLINMSKKMRFMSWTCAALILCNAVLSCIVWSESNREIIVMVPPGMSKVSSLSQDTVSSSYLESMALMVINARLNVTPDTESSSNHEVLNYVDPSYYASFKEKLLKEEGIVKEEKIASSFYPKEVVVNAKSLSVVVSGTLKRWVGLDFLGEDKKTYRVSFSRHGYLLLLSSFKEVKGGM